MWQKWRAVFTSKLLVLFFTLFNTSKIQSNAPWTQIAFLLCSLSSFPLSSYIQKQDMTLTHGLYLQQKFGDQSHQARTSPNSSSCRGRPDCLSGRDFSFPVLETRARLLHLCSLSSPYVYTKKSCSSVLHHARSSLQYQLSFDAQISSYQRVWQCNSCHQC